MKFRFKKLTCFIFAVLLCAAFVQTSFAADSETSGNMKDDVMDAVSTALDAGEDAVSTVKDAVDDALTDIKEDMDYAPEDGEPLAEGDGKVDSDDESDNEDSTAAETTGTDTSDRAEETTGIIEGMELDKKGINPWAIVIAVIAVVAVLALILILIPRRK